MINQLDKATQSNIVTRIKTGLLIAAYFLLLFILLAFSDVRQNGWVGYINQSTLKVLAPICAFLFVAAIGWTVYFVAEEIVTNILKDKNKKTIRLIATIMSVIEFVPTSFYLLANYGIFPHSFPPEVWVYLFLFLNVGMGLIFYPVLLHMVTSHSKRRSFDNIIFPMLVIGISWAFEWIYYFAIIRYWTTFLLLCTVVMSYDVFAYFAGTLFGKRHLAPTISPNKTWEGTLIGGGISLILTVSVLVSYGANTTIRSTIPGLDDGLQSSFFGAQLGISHTLVSGWWWFLSIFLIVILVLSSIMGDLFFSYCKRLNGIKDFGNKLPGHGGVLDRVDSLLFAALIFGTITGAISFFVTIMHFDAGAMFPNLAV